MFMKLTVNISNKETCVFMKVPVNICSEETCFFLKVTIIVNQRRKKVMVNVIAIFL